MGGSGRGKAVNQGRIFGFFREKDLHVPRFYYDL
jgi:hypothetical protein